ncbi:hypothetical protein J4573_30375 [Actinomadura barringtoniae]|uniref:Terpene synthase n=1 Tax=Actinomadura barringtoniae TaxID=1427535 RepID=A0A939T3N7_9ACTN|nr:terpene synthase family protein [Actinomadura barringtoniae]MBO2451431.1 hypothetical protein [Actinomadura barringtoniae]
MTSSALESGATCAVAGQGQRQMREWAAAYPGLYGAKAFDPALFSTLALAAAFSGPGLSARRLRMANRVCLWCFGLDWLIDYAATRADEVSDLVRRCKDVAASPRPAAMPAPPRPAAMPAPPRPAAIPAPPGLDGSASTPAVADLMAFLADITTELAAAPAFARLGEVWFSELSLMLDAMAREWTWKADRKIGTTDGTTDAPTFDAYLANADNLGFSFVLTSHWIAEGGHGEAEAVRAASQAVQRVIRLLNDLGTYERDLQWGDLNALLLDLTRGEVEARIADLTAEARTAIHDMRDGHRGLATYMERQMDFCAGFYGVTDFWGAL